jgi:hypothetical protein
MLTPLYGVTATSAAAEGRAGLRIPIPARKSPLALVSSTVERDAAHSVPLQSTLGNTADKGPRDSNGNPKSRGQQVGVREPKSEDKATAGPLDNQQQRKRLPPATCPIYTTLESFVPVASTRRKPTDQSADNHPTTDNQTTDNFEFDIPAASIAAADTPKAVIPADNAVAVATGQEDEEQLSYSSVKSADKPAFQDDLSLAADQAEDTTKSRQSGSRAAAAATAAVNILGRHLSPVRAVTPSDNELYEYKFRYQQAKGYVFELNTQVEELLKERDYIKSNYDIVVIDLDDWKGKYQAIHRELAFSGR